MGARGIFATLLASLALLSLSTVAGAQGVPGGGLEVRNWVGGHAGLYTHDPIDERCTTRTVPTAGVEVRTRGPWLAALGVDLMLPGSTTCALYAKTVEFQGESVEESTGVVSGITGRLSVRIGRTFWFYDTIVEPAAGIGLAAMPLDFVSGPSEMVWRPWFGGSLDLRSAQSRIGIQLEYGTRQVPIRYYTHRSGWEKVHEFYRWGNELRLLFRM